MDKVLGYVNNPVKDVKFFEGFGIFSRAEHYKRKFSYILAAFIEMYERGFFDRDYDLDTVLTMMIGELYGD